VRSEKTADATSFAFIPSMVQGAESTAKLRVAYPTLTASYAPAWITKEAQIFRKHALDFDLLFIQSSPVLVAAMLAGDAPIGLTNGAPLHRAT
jgi:ABC-type nitrate/sulfonate/bicarbonate transport system substrate-binding protein